MMNVLAVLTGDVVNSGKHPPETWIVPMKACFSAYGKSPADWEFYRGDEFQIRIPAAEALRLAIGLKALLKQQKALDVRLAIGIGEEAYGADRISESNGTAYQRSGRTFEQLKSQKVSLQLNSGRPLPDRTMNLILRLGLDFMDHWSTVSAEIITHVLDHPEATQKEIADELSIQQSAVSQRLKRARKELVYDMLEFYHDYLIQP